MRAGISRLQDLAIYHPTSEALVGAFVEAADSATTEIHVHLLVESIRELTTDWTPGQVEETAWFLCLSERGRVGRPPRIERWIVPELEERLGWSFPHQRVWLIHSGRTGVFRALREARTLLTRGEVVRCVVAGVESGVDETSVAELYRTRRLKTSRNPDGFYPGEAGAAVEILAAPNGSESDVQVSGLGFGVEPNPIGSEAPLRADGLTAAARTALGEAELEMGDLDWRLSDVTGEQYYFREASLVVTRLLRKHKDGFPLWHPADAIGDVGAAVGAVLLGMAAAAFRKGYAPGPLVLCQTSADSGDRAVAIVRGPA
jgi:3-oxoacyl-[acyl-carrier-protein] synthase-1